MGIPTNLVGIVMIGGEAQDSAAAKAFVGPGMKQDFRWRNLRRGRPCDREALTL